MKKNLLFIFYLFLIVCANTMFSQTKIIPFQELPTATGLPSGSGMFFGATMSGSSFTVNFSGPSDRWISFGLGASMSPADVFIYSNGKSGAIHALGWNDYYNSSSGIFGVNNDLVQNWNVISTGTVLPAQRNVTASRLLSTGDANDVALSLNDAALNLVWARGATADYTIAYHGVNNRAYFITLPWLSAPTASFSSTSTTVCAGAAIAYTNLSTGGSTTYTWNFQGGNPATSTSTNPSVSYAVPGTYSVALTASNAIGSNSIAQVAYITVTPTVAPSVTITQTNGSNPICAGALATFTSLSTNGGSNPLFQWQVNGINTGVTTAFYSSSNLQNAAAVRCVMVSNAVCAAPASATSAVITLTVNSTAPASASVLIVAGGNPLCTGAAVSFSVITVNGGTAPAYQWNINGVNTGNAGSSFSTNTLNNGDVVNCILSSNAACASSTTGISAGITMTVSSFLSPSVSVTLVNGNNPVCAGSVLSFSASAVNGGINPVFQWKLNGTNQGPNSASYTLTGANNGDVLSCLLLSGLSCASPGTVLSTALVVTVVPLPVAPVISPSGTFSLCAGNNILFVSSAPSGNLWSNGAISQSITVSSAGTYTVSQTLNGCTSMPSSPVSVIVNALPLVSMAAIAAICNASEPVLLNQGQPAGGSYSGAGVSSGSFFPSQSGAGTFTITYLYKDANNCENTANASIVVDACLGISALVVEEGLSLFPNPSGGKITIQSAGEKITGISITDLSGTYLSGGVYRAVDSVNCDISDAPAGFIIIAVRLETKTLRLKAIKQ